MDASVNCIELIHGSEGCYTKLPDGRFKSYLDKLPTKPVWTIWYGLTKGVGPDTVWTVEQCQKAFSKEMSIYEDAIERMVTVPLNQNQFDALVSLVYNIGEGSPHDPEKKGFYWSTLRKLLNQGKYEAAAGQFSRYKYSGGVVYGGLVTRRAKEAALFMTPMPEETHPEEEKPALPQSVEAGPVVSVREAVGSSSSIKMVAVAVPGAAVTWWDTLYNWTFGLVGQAGTEIVETQKLLTPFSAILKLTPSILVTITLGCLVAVAVRQYVKRRNGTAV